MAVCRKCIRSTGDQYANHNQQASIPGFVIRAITLLCMRKVNLCLNPLFLFRRSERTEHIEAATWTPAIAPGRNL
jgi:hypothetical protein